MKIKKIVSLILVGLFSSSGIALAEGPETLQKMIEKAVTENPEVQARYHAFKGSEYDQSAAKGGYLPKVNVDATSRNQEKQIPNINRTQAPNTQGTLTIRQMLFDGFATPAEVNRLDHVSKARYYELQAQMQSIALETAIAYYDLLRYRRLVAYAQDNFVTHKQVYDRIKSRVDAGVGKRVDLEQASGRLALAEANLVTENNNLYDVAARYQRLIGELPPDTISEEGIPTNSLSANATEALELAYKQNPNILSAIENIVAVEQSVRGRKSQFYPRLDLTGRKNLFANNAGENSFLAADSVELTASINLFNGFSDRARIDSAVEDLNRSHDLRDKACVDTRQQVSIAYNSILQLKDQIAYRKTHQESIEKARVAYRKQYDIGQRTLLDLLDTENEYFQARRNLTNAEMDLASSYAKTYAGQGELLTKTGVARADLNDMPHEEYLDRENVCKALAPVPLNINKEALLANAKPWADEMIKPKESAPEKMVQKFLPRILFETDSAVIMESSYKDLDITYEIIQGWGKDRIEVAGHTDKRNTSQERYNQQLSERRARAVTDYLVKKGFDAKRLTVKGYGFSKPVAENDPVSGSDLNRRVEVIRYQKIAQ